jgi:hypothetical protein
MLALKTKGSKQLKEPPSGGFLIYTKGFEFLRPGVDKVELLDVAGDYPVFNCLLHG